jgi:prepilin-type N-terminal cleavage/methylation domain-containing protein/prepilin-type processing-associated H-X9-DG protein
MSTYLRERIQRPRRNARRGGFTLVELLVVIAIIAVLIGILLPVLGKARETAKQVQCLANLRQFGIADQLYQNSYGFHMPSWWTTPGGLTFSYSAYNWYYGGLNEFRRTLSLPILPETDPQVGTVNYRCYVTRKWFCPSALTQTQFAPDPAGPAAGKPDYTTHDYYWPLHFSYGMNVMGVDHPADYLRGSSAGCPTDVYDARATQADPNMADVSKMIHGFTRGQVKHPSEKLQFCDAMYFAVNIYGLGASGPKKRAPYLNIQGWGSNVDSAYGIIGEVVTAVANNGTQSQRTPATTRHKGGANVVFFDGHGEFFKESQFYGPKDGTGNYTRNDKLWMVMNN